MGRSRAFSASVVSASCVVSCLFSCRNAAVSYLWRRLDVNWRIPATLGRRELIECPWDSVQGATSTARHLLWRVQWSGFGDAQWLL